MLTGIHKETCRENKTTVVSCPCVAKTPTKQNRCKLCSTGALVRLLLGGRLLYCNHFEQMKQHIGEEDNTLWHTVSRGDLSAYDREGAQTLPSYRHARGLNIASTQHLCGVTMLIIYAPTLYLKYRTTSYNMKVRNTKNSVRILCKYTVNNVVTYEYSKRHRNTIK